MLAIVNPRGMGMGDAKLAFLIGVALGSRTIAAMVFTSGALIVLAIGLVACGAAPGSRRRSLSGRYLRSGRLSPISRDRSPNQDFSPILRTRSGSDFPEPRGGGDPWTYVILIVLIVVVAALYMRVRSRKVKT